MKGRTEMDNFTVNAQTGTSSSVATPKLRFSVSPNAKIASKPSVFPPLTSLKITGSLPGGRHLTHPLEVIFEYGDGEVIVSEPHFHMHASAPTTTEALVAFRRIFSGYLDVLTSRESRLNSYLREQLAYLRSYISTE